MMKPDLGCTICSALVLKGCNFKAPQAMNAALTYRLLTELLGNILPKSSVSISHLA